MTTDCGKKTPAAPDLALDSVWEEHLSTPPAKAAAGRKKVYGLLQYFDDDAQKGIYDELIQIEADSQRQDNRLLYIRGKIMDLVDRQVAARHLRRMAAGRAAHPDNPGSSDSAGESLDLVEADCKIQIAILRAYTRKKYGDGCHPRDWFAFYQKLAELFQKKIDTGRASDPAGFFYFNGRPMQATIENFQLCRNKCLNAYIGMEFDGPTSRATGLQKILRAIKNRSFWRKLIS